VSSSERPLSMIAVRARLQAIHWPANLRGTRGAGLSELLMEYSFPIKSSRRELTQSGRKRCQEPFVLIAYTTR
jgi:hypothetical protein